MAELVIALPEQAPRARVLPEVDRVLMSRLLSMYLRELRSECTTAPSCRPSAGAPFGTRQELRIPLQATGRSLSTTVLRSSFSGHHELGGAFLLVESQGATSTITSPVDLARVLLDELAAREGEVPRQAARHAELLADIRCSIRNTHAFCTAREQSDFSVRSGIERTLAAEQSLPYGHPFHPAPKSDEAQLGAYRPERRAQFQLHYFAVNPALLLERRLPGCDALLPSRVLNDVRDQLAHAGRALALLPAHPFQAEHLLQQERVRALMQRGDLVHMGALGEPVIATSSVRTVYAPQQDLFLKLPLDVRITNFVRNNPIEQLDRSLDASFVLRQLEPSLSLTILPELAYRSLAEDPKAEAGQDDLSASFAVLYRGGLRAHEHHAPVVVAALLEPSGSQGEPPLAKMLWTAARSCGAPLTASSVSSWLRRYSEVVFVPTLATFVRHGISLEAHVQNSLVGLLDGIPSRLFVRDLEGTSIARNRAEQQEYFKGAARPSSPAMLDARAAWERLLYYLVVNHAAHLIATLAACTPAEEWQLWHVLRSTVEDAVELHQGCGRAYMEDLLGRPTLPAKANLLSRLGGRSEKPLYVGIPNPLAPDMGL